MKRTFACLLTGLAVFAAATVFAQYENFDQAQSAAEYALRVRDPRTAREALTAAINLAAVVSQKAWAHCELGLLLAQGEAADPAASREQFIAARDLENVPPIYRGLALVNLGRLDLAAGNVAAAREEYRRGIELTGQGSALPVIRMQLSRLSLVPGTAEAARAATAALLADEAIPADLKVLVLVSYGDIFRCQGKLSPAAESYSQARDAAAAAPATLPLVLSRQADLAREQRRWQEALDLYREVLAMDGISLDQRAHAQLQIGNCLYGLEKRDEARTAWQAVKAIPDVPRAYVTAATARLEAPDPRILRE